MQPRRLRWWTEEVAPPAKMSVGTAISPSRDATLQSAMSSRLRAHAAALQIVEPNMGGRPERPLPRWS